MACQSNYHQNFAHKNGLEHPLNQQVAIVMVPCPGQSHLNMLLHLSHLITSSYQIPIHFTGSATQINQAKIRININSKNLIHFHGFELPHNPNNPSFLETILHTITHLRQPIFEFLRKLSTKFTRIVVIYDFLVSSVVKDVKFIPNAEAYTFHPISAFTQFFNAWESIPGEKPFELDFSIDQIPPSNKDSILPELGGFIAEQYRVKSEFECGRIYDTNRVIEGKYIELLEKLSSIKHFSIGPFNPVEVNSSITTRTLDWLDKQEKKSVIYVSFGTMASMIDDQIRELAIGLERSDHKFIWVLTNADAELAEGFEERVKDRGMVVRDWAPQLEILAHPSTGGFMSHCGWSSCIESISMGVPIAGWPMNADQPKNSTLVTKVLRVGFLVRDWETRAELVTSSMVENVVRRLMESQEGEEVRRRAAELGNAVRGSVAEGGSTRLEMDSFIAHITRSDN